jgi:hypothetical protein
MAEVLGCAASTIRQHRVPDQTDRKNQRVRSLRDIAQIQGICQHRPLTDLAEVCIGRIVQRSTRTKVGARYFTKASLPCQGDTGGLYKSNECLSRIEVVSEVKYRSISKDLGTIFCHVAVFHQSLRGHLLCHVVNRFGGEARVPCNHVCVI